MNTRVLLINICLVTLLSVTGNKIIFSDAQDHVTPSETIIETEPTKPLIANSKDLQETVVTSNFDEPISYEKNYIFTCSFNLAWNKLIDLLPGDSIELADHTSLVTYLNQREFTDNVLSEESYLAEAAFFEQDTIEILNAKLREKFEDPLQLDIEYKEGLSVFVTFAYFEKDLKFEIPFEGAHEIEFSSGQTRSSVKAFGFDNEQEASNYENQITIDYFDFESDAYIVSFLTQSVEDELILACVQPEETIRKTYEKILTLKSSNDSYVSILDIEDFRVPKINIEIKHEYDEIIGQRILNFEYDKVYVAGAEQEIQFTLDEYGATARVLSSMWGEKSKPLELIFNKPFMLIMKQTDSDLPYLLIWVGNSEILLRV